MTANSQLQFHRYERVLGVAVPNLTLLNLLPSRKVVVVEGCRTGRYISLAVLFGFCQASIYETTFITDERSSCVAIHAIERSRFMDRFNANKDGKHILRIDSMQTNLGSTWRGESGAVSFFGEKSVAGLFFGKSL